MELVFDAWSVVRRYATPATGRILNLVSRRLWKERQYKKKLYPCTALALREGDSHLFSFFLERGKVSWLTWVEACRYGDPQLLDQLAPHPERKEYSRYLWQAAVESGKMEVCRWLSDHGRNISTLAFTTAVRTGNLPLLQELWTTYPVSTDKYTEHNHRSEAIINCIAEVGDIEMLSWLEDKRLPITDPFMIHTIACGNVRLASALLERGYRFDLNDLRNLGLRNGKQMLELFGDYRLPLSPVLCNALVGKDFAFADELYNQVEPNLEELYEAAIRGGIESIRWCQNKGLTFAPRELYTSSAAIQGNAEVMRFLREQGQDWIPDLHRYAARRNHMAMLDYLWKEYPKEYWEKLPLETGKQSVLQMKDLDEVLSYKRKRRWLRQHLKN